MVAVAVWRGDEFTASVMSDSLIIWPEFLNYGFSADIWLETALLKPDLCDLAWEDTLIELQFREPKVKYEPTPEEVFQVIIENLWIDVLLTLSSVISAWGLGWGDRDSLPSRVFRKLLFAKSIESEAYLRRSDLVPGESAEQALLSLMRQYTSGKRFNNSSYHGWLDKLVSMFDSLTEREVVPGRGYTPSTKHELNDLRLSQLAILMSLAAPDSSTGFPARFEEVITIISQLPGTDKPARHLKRILEDFRKSLGEMPVTERLPVLTGFSEISSDIDNYEERKTAIDDLLKSALDLVQRERTVRIEKLAVQQKQIDNLTSAIENNVFVENVHTFPLCEFTIVPGSENLTESTIFKQSGYEKGSLTDPEMADPASNEQESFSSRTTQAINVHLLRKVFSENIPEDIVITDHAHYWEIVKEKGAELTGQGLEPLLLARSRVQPLWINPWVRHPGSRANPPKPEDLSISRDPSEQAKEYLVTFNNIKVYTTLIKLNVSYILPREIFQNLEILPFTSGHKINIRFQQGDDPWHGDLVFNWAYKLQVPSYPISRLIRNKADK